MKLFNTLTGQKEEFVTLEENKVKMYVCGPTVYNYFHLGNARPFIIFDAFRNFLEFQGYKVDFVQNFTDIDDKMINKANELGITINELADTYIEAYFTDARGLGIKDATIHPKATENIGSIIKLVKTLVDKGVAYEVEGDVYFDISKFPQYGKLSHKNIEDLESGSRVEVDSRKRNPIDFALWKSKKEGEPSWKSPWGAGRPGWHIECSAMANKYLGDTIDIHCGGQDLIFPHHENEIAQSEAANGKPFANYWMHNGHINVDNEKMAKSKGNFFMVKDIVKDFEYEVLRFFILSAHYRSPFNFSETLLIQAKSALDRLYSCVENINYTLKNNDNTNKWFEFKSEIQKLGDKYIESLSDDFNTAEAIGVLFEMVKAINIYSTDVENISSEALIYAKAELLKYANVIGLLTKDMSQDEFSDEIKGLVEERQEARKTKNWARADEIRDILKEMNIVVEDTSKGVKINRI